MNASNVHKHLECDEEKNEFFLHWMCNRLDLCAETSLSIDMENIYLCVCVCALFAYFIKL